MSAKHFMREAFAHAHGQFKAKAKAAGESTREYAEDKKGAPGRTGQQARLALVGMRAKKK